MANVTIPAYDTSLERQSAIAVEAAQARRKALDAPWYNEKLDPSNFENNEFLDPQHIAMFNGTAGGRSGASFRRTLTAAQFNPRHHPPPGASGRDTVNPLHPETRQLSRSLTPSTCVPSRFGSCN
jgi:hypothetical protein